MENSKFSERELWEVTRMPRPALEAVIEQSLMLEPWKVVVAYCEHQRRGGSVPPRIENSFRALIKDRGYADAPTFISDTLKELGFVNYTDLLNRVNQVGSGPGSMQDGTPQALIRTERPSRAEVKPSLDTDNSVSPPKAQEPWYNQTWLVVLLCLVFFPVGLYALLKNEIIGKGWKYGVLSLFALSLIGALGNETREQKQSHNEANVKKDCSEWSSSAAVKERIQSIGGYYVGEWGAAHESNGCVHVWYISFIDKYGTSRMAVFVTDGSSGKVMITDVKMGRI